MVSAGTGRIDASFKRGSRQFLKRVKQSDPDEKAPEERYELNRELYERKIRFAGYYGLITCCEDLSDEEIYSRLRELWKIENCFRVMEISTVYETDLCKNRSTYPRSLCRLCSGTGFGEVHGI